MDIERIKTADGGLYQRDGANARWKTIDTHLAHIDWGGQVTGGVWQSMGESLARDSANVVTLQRFDDVEFEFPNLPTLARNIDRSNAPAALIARPDQVDFFNWYTGKVAQIGVVRVLFLSSEIDSAFRWAERIAGATRAALAHTANAPRPARFGRRAASPSKRQQTLRAVKNPTR